MIQPIRNGNCYMINIPSPLVSFYSDHIMRYEGHRLFWIFSALTPFRNHRTWLEQGSFLAHFSSLYRGTVIRDPETLLTIEYAL